MRYFVRTIFVIMLLGIGPLSSAQERWPDYMAIEYDILPNLTYAVANNIELKLDVHLPKNRKNGVPVLVYFHGGGWVDGRKERNNWYLLPYLSMGFAVVNVEYRIARQSLAPAAVEDVRCALRWVHTNAETYSFDRKRIVLTGPSAGAHLALIGGMLPQGSVFDHQCATSESTRWKEPTEPALSVAAIINWYGITDVSDILSGPNAKHYVMEWFGALPHAATLAKEVSPLTYVRSGLPPIISIHGDADNIVPYQTQAVPLHKALTEVGVANQLITVKGGQHGGFNKEIMLDSFAQIRVFLTKHQILP